jgi:hypothetical protein
MHSLVYAKRGAITFGGLITTIDKAIRLGDRLANLEQIPARFIDLDMVKSMNLVRQRTDGKFNLMINNHVFPDTILPNPRRTDVCDHNNLCYIHDPVPNQAPTHIS